MNSSPIWTPQRLKDLSSIRPMVVSSAARMNHSSEVEDVMQEVFIVANRKMETFDEERGTFRAWLMGIAYNLLRQTVDHTQTELRAQETMKSHISHAININNAPFMDEMATRIVDRLDSAQHLSEILVLLAQVEEPTIFERSLRLLRDYDGNVQKASAALEVSPAALRDTHRHLLDMAKVIHNALELHRQRREQSGDENLKVGELLSCFPDPDDTETDRQWLRIVPSAVFRAGGWNQPQQELIQAVCVDTGYSFNTARLAVRRCSMLFMVARTVAETGSLS